MLYIQLTESHQELLHMIGSAVPVDDIPKWMAKNGLCDLKSLNRYCFLNHVCANHRSESLQIASLVDYLISQGMDVNQADNSGVTPLHIAARYSNSIPMIQVLLKNGASTTAKNIDDDIPLVMLKTRMEELMEFQAMFGIDVSISSS